MDQLVVDLAVRLVAHWKIQPGFLINNTLVMRESAESIQSMVGTHAALAEAAKSHIACGKVDDRVVHASAAEAYAGCDIFYKFTVRGKNIQCQRVRL